MKKWAEAEVRLQSPVWVNGEILIQADIHQDEPIAKPGINASKRRFHVVKLQSVDISVEMVAAGI